MSLQEQDAQRERYGDNHGHSVRADVNVLGAKIDTRSDAMARIRRELDDATKLLRDLFDRYLKAQADLAGVGLEVRAEMEPPLEAAFAAYLREKDGSPVEDPELLGMPLMPLEGE